MTGATAKVVRKGGSERFLAKARRAVWGTGKRVKVGFPQGGEVAAIAAYNEWGTVHIPERPFIRTAIRSNYNAYRRLMRTYSKQILRGNMPKRQALELIGIRAANDIKAMIRSNMPPPNAPATIREKDSKTTLIDTGRMLGAVRHEVE